MRSAAILLLGLFVFSPQGNARGYVIGNGGDGYKLNGKIYVTDLLEAGLEKRPLPADGPVAKRISRELEKLNLPPGYPHEALARKLTELNRRAPGLGDSLLVSMSLYRWRLLDIPIGRVRDLEGRTLGLPDSSRVQLAVRLADVIRIQAAHWEKLDEANRAALILHEAFYSMLFPIFYKEIKPGHQILIQSSRLARELVGLAFDTDSATTLLSKSMQSLGSDLIGNNNFAYSRHAWKIMAEENGKPKGRVFAFRFTDFVTKPALVEFIANTCREVASVSAPNLTFGGVLMRITVNPILTSYESPFGDQNQVSLRTRSERQYEFYGSPPGVENCIVTLSTYIPLFESLGFFEE